MMKRIIILLILIIALVLLFAPVTSAASTDSVLPSISVDIGGESADGASSSLEIIFLITILSLLPSIMIMMTSFTRIIIVLSFVRSALGLQQTPPNQVLIGLALFLTFFIMSPIINQINTQAYTPYTKGEITQTEAIDKAEVPLREFMLKQVDEEDLNMFISLSPDEIKAKNVDDIKTNVVVAAFITSELKRAFTIGFLIFLPFLIIDMVVASVLMSMGMVMLPPVMISLPFKLILFVLVDGWGLIVKTLILSFH